MSKSPAQAGFLLTPHDASEAHFKDDNTEVLKTERPGLGDAVGGEQPKGAARQGTLMSDSEETKKTLWVQPLMVEEFAPSACCGRPSDALVAGPASAPGGPGQ